MRPKLARWWVAATLLALTAVSALAAGRGYLGVTTQAIDEDLRRGLDLTRNGLLVNQVSVDSPADRAGLRKGDVILSYEGRSVTDPEALRTLVRDTTPGRSAAVSIWRNGTRRTLDVTVGELPGSQDERDNFDTPPTPDVPSPPEAPQAPRAPRAPRDDDRGDVQRRIIINGHEVPQDEIDDSLKDLPKELQGLGELRNLRGMRGMNGWSSGPGGAMFFARSPLRGRLGVRIEKLNGDLGEALGLDGDKGVLVTEVLEDTPAQKAGIRAGDVIVRVGDRSVDTPDALVSALADLDGSVSITVERKGVSRDLEAELEPRADGGASSRLRADLDSRSRNPEPGQGARGFRVKAKADAGDETDLREEIRQLQQELRDLRRQMEQMQDKR